MKRGKAIHEFAGIRHLRTLLQLRVLSLRECKSVSGAAFAEQQAFASLESLNMNRCFAFCLEGASCHVPSRKQVFNSDRVCRTTSPHPEA